MVPPDRSNPQTTILSTEFDSSIDDPITVHVARAISAASDQTPIDLPPLGKTVDVDALEALIDPNTPDVGAASEISFEYAGYRVHIDSIGVISLQERTE